MMAAFLFGGAVFLLLDYLAGARLTITVALVIYTILVARQIHEQHVRVRDRETARYRLAERRG